VRYNVFIIVSLLVLATIPTGTLAKNDAMMGEDIYIEWDPCILTLAPGEEGDITLTVHGNRKNTTMIGIRWNFIDGPGGPDGEVNPDYFELGSHEEQEVNVHVISRADRSASECASDVRLTFYWGPNLTREGTWSFDRDSADGSEDLQIHVNDDFSSTLTDSSIVVPIILVAIIVVLIGIIVLMSRKKD
jgi:uncharacterized membrane protein